MAELYTKGLSGSFKNICSKQGIQVHFKGGNTIKNLLVIPKDKDTNHPVGDRFKEHLKATSPIYGHSNITGHYSRADSFSIVGRQSKNLTRLIKEAIFIRVNYPSLNQEH